MSTQNKLRGGSESELTKLKELWRGLSEEAREYWRALFISKTTQADVRSQLQTKLKIKLSQDTQLNRFRTWVDRQDAMEAEAEAMLDDERNFTEQYGEKLTKDQIRELVLGASYRRSLATGNFKEGRATAKLDLAIETAKFQAGMETDKLQLARDAEARMRDQFKLDREKFEFDAAKAALAQASKLQTVFRSKTLSEAEKVDQTRQLLFGVLPK